MRGQGEHVRHTHTKRERRGSKCVTKHGTCGMGGHACAVMQLRTHFVDSEKYRGGTPEVFGDRHLLVQEEAVTRVRELLSLVSVYSPISLR